MYMLKKIQETVAQHYGVRVAEMLSSTRDAKVAEARQVAMYVARKYTTKSLPEIAYAFGKRHATVIHAVKAIEKRIANEVNLKEVIEGLCGQLVAKDVPHDEGTDSQARMGFVPGEGFPLFGSFEK